jgi:hypothetical protein
MAKRVKFCCTYEVVPRNSVLEAVCRISMSVERKKWASSAARQKRWFCNYYYLLTIIKNTVYKLMWWLYRVLQWRGRVFIQRCHLRCLASLKFSIVNNYLTPLLLCAERVDELPGLSRGNEVTFADMPTTLMIWLCGRSFNSVLTSVGLIRAVPINETHLNEVPYCHFEVSWFFLNLEVLCWSESFVSPC